MTHLMQQHQLLAVPAYTSHMRSHIKAAEAHLRNDSDELRQCSPEQMLYFEYSRAGQPHGPALYAVKGEHWNGVSPKFLEFINSFQYSREDMGYSECGYGIQRHRDFMRQLILAEHGLESRRPASGLDIDVGCLAMTTRMWDSMWSFFRSGRRMVGYPTWRNGRISFVVRSKTRPATSPWLSAIRSIIPPACNGRLE